MLEKFGFKKSLVHHFHPRFLLATFFPSSKLQSWNLGSARLHKSPGTGGHLETFFWGSDRRLLEGLFFAELPSSSLLGTKGLHHEIPKNGNCDRKLSEIFFSADVFGCQSSQQKDAGSSPAG